MQSWLELIFTLVLVLVFATVIFLLPSSRYGVKTKSKRTQILVIGDIGRSPRMQNHAISLLKRGVPVDLIGYVDSDLHPQLQNQALLTIHHIPPTPDLLSLGGRSLFPLTAPLKVLFQSLSLWRILASRTPAAKWLLVQNPPSIPTLLLAALICPLRGTKLAVDWHNYGFTILALKLGRGHPLVRVAEMYERWLARAADVNFAVSEAMCEDLRASFGVKDKAGVRRLYDRPGEGFVPLKDADRARVMGRLVEGLGLSDAVKEGVRGGSMKVVVSSTSWTPDEDFGILLDALVGYSRDGEETKPRLLVIITGKGPQKEEYLGRVGRLEREGKLGLVTITTAWLSTEDYASLLAAADVGVCLHQSSSGLDLPMKVVDMFGAGLPVVGYAAYKSWSELVVDGVNGKNFESPKDLQQVLESLLTGDGHQLKGLRREAVKESSKRWQTEWDAVAGKAMGVVK